MAYLVICLCFGLAGGIVGRTKGSSFALWFLIAALVPLVGLIAAVFFRTEAAEVRRQCPTCGKVVKLHDQLCMRCGEDLYFPDTAIEPETGVVRR